MSVPTRIKKTKYNADTLPEQTIKMVLTRIGCYESNESIIGFLKDSFGMDVEPKTIEFYRNAKAYQAAIDGYRGLFEADILKVELSSKRRRMEELQELYYVLKGKKWYSKAKDMLAQIRVEREGTGSSSGDVYQFNQFNALPDSVLLERQKANAEMIEKLKKRNEITLEASNG